MADVLRDPAPDSIEHPALRSLFEYWSGRREGARLPSRKDIDPLDIPGLLPHLMLIDVEAAAARDPALRYRLVGTALVARMGRDTTGLSVEEGYIGEDWEKILSDYRYVIAERRPCLRRKRGIGRARRPYAYQRLLLPLAADGAAVDMILAGAFWLDGA